MEYIHAQSLRYPPGPPRIRVGGHTFIHDAGGANRQRTIDDVGVACDPSYIGETPINVLRVNVLIILRRSCNIGQISPGAMLTALRLCRRTAGVHHEQRSFSWHRYWIDSFPAKVFEQIINEVIPTLHHGRRGGVLSGITPPNQNFIHMNAVLRRRFNRFVGFDFLIEEFTISVVAIHSDENMTAGVRYSAPAGS